MNRARIVFTGNLKTVPAMNRPSRIFQKTCGTKAATPCNVAVGQPLGGGGGASKLFAKPSWQSRVPGIPNDGARDVPDVSFTGAGHDPYLIRLDGSCKRNSKGQFSLQGVSGTSAAVPSFAGMMTAMA